MAENKKTKDSTSKYTIADQFNGGRVMTPKRDKENKVKMKPGVDYSSLRNLSRNNDIVRIAIDRVKHRVTKTPWIIRAKDSDRHEELESYIEYVKKLLMYPNANDDTFRLLVSKITEDILVIDRGVIEKVRNVRGDVVNLYQVDGSTIYPNIDENGMYQEPAYYQFLRGEQKPTAELEMDDVMIFMVNPRSEGGLNGYGSSPVENVVTSVLTSLQAAIYNAGYFDSAKLPPFMANLKDVSVEDLIAFKTAFENQLSNGNWSNAYTNASDLKVEQLRPSNQDMQFMDFNVWLARIICAEFEISPQEIGLTMDINKSTGEEQGKITSEGIDNILQVIAEEINMDLIGDLATNLNENFEEIEFVWDIELQLSEKERAEVDKIHVETGLREINELRARDGLDPIEEKEEVPTFEDILAKNRIQR